MDTFSSHLSHYKGLGPGFDFLRVGLAASIVMTHTALLSDREAFVRDTPLWYVEYALVPMFFALSGFLVAGSAMRLSLGNFLTNRSLRIMPALAVDVVICALIIGPIMTTLPLSDYYTHPTFFAYFLNITGWIHYLLPGVFESNFSAYVNGALWTVPYEIACYATMSILIVTGIIHKPRLTLVLTLAYLCIGVLVGSTLGREMLTGTPGYLLRGLTVSRGAQLVAAFLMGILAYQYRDRIPYSLPVLMACGLICLTSVFMLDARAINAVPNRFFVLPALV